MYRDIAVSRKLTLIGLLLACSLISTFCREARDTTIPEKLLGVWTTSNARYKDRFFELTPTSALRLGTGEANVDIYVIWNIESVPQHALTLYTITYLNSSGDEYLFKFRYDPFDSGIITFVNQGEMKWTREEL